MKTLNLEQILQVHGGDRWVEEKTSTLSEAQALLLSDCLGGLGGHDGNSATSCVLFFFSRNQ